MTKRWKIIWEVDRDAVARANYQIQGMTKRWKIIWACLVVAIPFGILFLNSGAHWVGNTDLQVVFLVLDAETGEPVPSAEIDFESEGGGFCREDREKAKYTLQADPSGRLIRRWTDCMCFGTKTWLKDTFSTHVPPILFRASAPNYAMSEWTYLEDSRNLRAVKREKEFATLEVKISLRRTHTSAAMIRIFFGPVV